MQRIKNQTLPGTALLFAINSPSALEALSTLPLTITTTTNSTNQVTDFKRSSHNILILKAADVGSVEVGTDDLLFVEINSAE